MAKTHSLSAVLLLLLLVASSTATTHRFSQTLSPATLKLGREKLSHLHFYFHDIVSGHHPTAVKIAQANSTSSSSTMFGALAMIDDPLTAGPDPASRLVGRAQGLYGTASQSETALLMAMNMHFVDGKYNGSTITVLGRNAVFDTVREMPIVGGTGAFRFARGYAQARTHTFDVKSGDAVVEYNVYVFHH